MITNGHHVNMRTAGSYLEAVCHSYFDLEHNTQADIEVDMAWVLKIVHEAWELKIVYDFVPSVLD